MERRDETALYRVMPSTGWLYRAKLESNPLSFNARQMMAMAAKGTPDGIPIATEKFPSLAGVFRGVS